MTRSLDQRRTDLPVRSDGPGGPSSVIVHAIRWLGCVVLAASAQAREPLLVQNTDGRPASSFRAEGQSMMIASAGEAATRAGLEVLENGGNAVDAAVAVSFAISVIRPQSTGIGGGGFMLVYDAEEGQTQVYDFRETAPGAAHRDMYLEDGEVVPDRSVVGHLSVGVPGTVAGLIEVHEKHGSRPLAELLAPAIRLAEEGFEVYPELARRLAGRGEVIARNPAMARIFLPGGNPLKEGELFVQSDLAKTLRAIAEGGRAGFYDGPVAKAIVDDMKANGGLITKADLVGYSVKTREPVRGTYRGYEVVSMPPPSSGGIHVIQMLNVLEGYDPLNEPLASHVMIEAMRQAYADRAAFLGDPDFVTIPTERLISKSYAEETRKAISLDRARDSRSFRPLLAPPEESPSTTHFSIVDAKGNVVSSTQTINYSFGACVVAEGTGVILNDEMDDFSARPGVPNVYGLIGGEANSIAPGKRPLSSMSPTIVLREGKPVLVLGSPGGSRIITAVLQTIVNVIDHRMDLLDAVARGRLHHQWLPDQVDVEQDAFPLSTVDALGELGHRVVPAKGPLGEVQAVQILEDGTLIGVSDPRRSGRPMGR